jgi:hypothetical protein
MNGSSIFLKKLKEACRQTSRNVSRDQSGVVLLTTVILLLLITVIGISGINTATTDIQITQNYRVYKQNLAFADAAVNRAISLIAYEEADTSDSWVNDISDLYNSANGSKYFKSGTDWDSATTPVLNEIDVDAVIADWDAGVAAINPTTLPGQANTQFVVYMNLNSTEGNSVVISRSRVDNGNVILEAGFNKE